jgi:hypothetical protein
MTTLLERAIEEARASDDATQDVVASVILEIIEDERKWDALFAQGHEALARLADEVLAEHRAGLTEPLVFDDL